MRTHGTLAKWNEERGFGFVTPAQGIEEVFVHVSAFPRDGVRPRIGELISFEIEPGKDGKKRALQVMRPGKRAAPGRSHNRESSGSRRNPIAAVIGLLAITAIGAYGYSTLAPEAFVSPTTPTFRPAPASSPNRAFHCDGRTHCSQMTSCAEAKNFLRHCPNTTMDGDNDGRPCEQQWCN